MGSITEREHWDQEVIRRQTDDLLEILRQEHPEMETDDFRSRRRNHISPTIDVPVIRRRHGLMDDPLQAIIAEAAFRNRVPFEMLTSGRRYPSVTRARREAMREIRQKHGLSFRAIGALLNIDHRAATRAME